MMRALCLGEQHYICVEALITARPFAYCMAPHAAFLLRYTTLLFSESATPTMANVAFPVALRIPDTRLGVT